ncbi:nuclear protein UL55 [Spheniscid alphaherpesvirus 1]|uniref:Nuclear protein UL55 n=1 Tax=Spheniscid alphaherpesvirus 1 TaxID=2560777 RepID=A0A1R3TAU9_9ALPH|nr:nuclear protein UL55 [Spheniscid alphaherpesvirus 1]SCO83486.1 nuclear protein UL55 [Spheniscid alphaherpesvirus 1]
MATVDSADNSDVFAKAADFLAEIPDINQVIAPMALDISYHPTEKIRGAKRSRSYLMHREYSLRIKCDGIGTCHSYMIGVSSSKNDYKTMKEDHLIKFCELLNHSKVLNEISNDSKILLCSAPFSAATQTDKLSETSKRVINGVCYHCHCKEQFSVKCWKAAFVAATKIIFIGHGVATMRKKREKQ